MHRYTRDARKRARPAQLGRGVTVHHGDEFDEHVVDGNLQVDTLREYTPKVPQEWDETTEAVVQEKQAFGLQLGALFEGAEPVVTSNGFNSYLAAFDKRSNSQPDVTDDLTKDFEKEAGKFIASLPSFERFDTDDALLDQWMETMDENKKERMLKALDGMFQYEDDDAYLGTKQLSVKIETLLKRYDPSWAPRLIYAGNDEFNALTGPVALQLGRNLAELCKGTIFGGISIRMCYKANDVEIARHLDRPEFNFGYEGDFSSNDLWQRAGVTRLMSKLYRKLGAPEWFITLLENNRSYKVFNREFGHVAYLENQLPTGTTVTTVRNTAWNIIIQMGYLRKYHRNAKGVACCLGDDWLMALDSELDVVNWQEYVSTEAKMKLKGFKVDMSGQATLLSRRLCFYGETPCMMPRLGKALARFNARANVNPGVTNSQYMAGKALCYAYEFRHFPLFRDIFMERYDLEGKDSVLDASEMSWFTRTSGIDISKIHDFILSEKVLVSEDSTREFLMDAYGMTFGLATALEVTRQIVLTRSNELVLPPEELAIDW